METAASFEARFAPWSYPAHYVVGEILLRHMSSKPVSRELTPAGTSAHRRLFAHVDGLTGCQHLDKAGKQPARALPSTSRGSTVQEGNRESSVWHVLAFLTELSSCR